MSYNGSPTATNPALLLNGAENSFNWTIDITVQSSISLNTYTIIVTDTEGDEDSESFSVDTDLSANAPLAVAFVEDASQGYFWNDFTSTSWGTSFKVGLTANPNPSSNLYTITVLENGAGILYGVF